MNTVLVIESVRRAGMSQWSTRARPNEWHPLDTMLDPGDCETVLMPQRPAEITIMYPGHRPFTVNLR